MQSSMYRVTFKDMEKVAAAVVSILNDMENRTDLSFDLRDNNPEDALEDDDIYHRSDLIVRINDKLRITSFGLSTRWTAVKLPFLSQFPYLNSLSLWGRFATTEGDGWADLDTIFNGV